MKYDKKYPKLIIREISPNKKEYTYFNKTIKKRPEQGTCSVQILRSSTMWSQGIKTEVLKNF